MNECYSMRYIFNHRKKLWNISFVFLYNFLQDMDNVYIGNQGWCLKQCVFTLFSLALPTLRSSVCKKLVTASIGRNEITFDKKFLEHFTEKNVYDLSEQLMRQSLDPKDLSL